MKCLSLPQNGLDVAQQVGFAVAYSGRGHRVHTAFLNEQNSQEGQHRDPDEEAMAKLMMTEDERRQAEQAERDPSLPIPASEIPPPGAMDQWRGPAMQPLTFSERPILEGSLAGHDLVPLVLLPGPFRLSNSVPSPFFTQSLKTPASKNSTSFFWPPDATDPVPGPGATARRDAPSATLPPLAQRPGEGEAATSPPSQPVLPLGPPAPQGPLIDEVHQPTQSASASQAPSNVGQQEHRYSFPERGSPNLSRQQPDSHSMVAAANYADDDGDVPPPGAKDEWNGPAMQPLQFSERPLIEGGIPPAVLAVLVEPSFWLAKAAPTEAGQYAKASSKSRSAVFF